MGKLSKIIDNLQDPALQAVGYMAGMGIQRGINKIWETDGVNGLLGDDTAVDFKRWVTPIATCFIGIAVSNYASSDSALKPIGDGIAVNGAVTVGKEILFGKPEMAGLSGGLLGGLMGDDDLDLVDLDDDDDDDYAPTAKTVTPSATQPALPSQTAGFGRTLPSGRAKMVSPETVLGLGASTSELVVL